MSQDTALLQEMVDLQRYKISRMQKEHENELDNCRIILQQILKELGASSATISEFGPMCAHNMKCTLTHIEDRNNPNTAGWTRYHGLKAIGEK